MYALILFATLYEHNENKHVRINNRMMVALHISEALDEVKYKGNNVRTRGKTKTRRIYVSARPQTMMSHNNIRFSMGNASLTC